MRPATDSEIEHWDDLVTAQGMAASVLQGRAFAQIKSRVGWQPTFYLADKVPLLVLRRKIMGLGMLSYLPGGPMTGSLPDLAKLLPDLRSLPGFAVQLEPELEAYPAKLAKLVADEGLVQRPGVQPNRSTVVVDLTPDEAEILSSFHSKTRYNVRLAERKGVTVEATKLTDESMALMYRLMKSSQERGGYYLRPQRYFTEAWKTYSAQRSGQLFLARYDDQVLAGAFVTYLGRKALYKDGGSVREHREVQPMSLLQWEIMRWLKGHGVERYDLHGVPPVDLLDDPTHPFAGLARFKTSFSDRVVTHVGMLDLPLNLSKYRLWRRAGERLYGTALYRLRGRSIY